MTHTTRAVSAATAAVLAVALAACGAAAGTTAAPSTAAATASAATVATSAPAASTATVSANTASEDEIAGALQAAGVGNASRWAGEVVEYRPYAADDTNFGSLREELAKYNPDTATINKIVSVLTP